MLKEEKIKETKVQYKFRSRASFRSQVSKVQQVQHSASCKYQEAKITFLRHNNRIRIIEFSITVTPSDIQIATLFSTSVGSMYVYGTSRLLFLTLMATLNTSSSP